MGAEMMTADSLAHTIERATAQRDAALDYLERMLRMAKSIDYSTPEQQATLRGVRALLVDAGRKVP